VRFKVTEEQEDTIIKALAEGDVFVQTIASIESDDFSGPPIALQPYEIGKVVVPDGEQVTLKYHVVPDDAVDQLIGHLNAQNAEFQESTKVRVYESGCSKGSKELGRETCEKRAILKRDEMDPSCRVKGNGTFDVRHPYSPPRPVDGCTQYAGCVFDPYKGTYALAGTLEEYNRLHRPALGEPPDGSTGHYVAYFTCKNRPTDQFVVNTPLPEIVEPTMDNIVPKDRDEVAGEN
jgi:hypothetical protein